jgi:hypothetical protein
MNTSQKTALNWKKIKNLYIFGNRHFSASFGQVFHRNGKCKRKFANIPFNNKNKKTIGLICILKN